MKIKSVPVSFADQRLYPRLLVMVRLLSLAKLSIVHLRFMDFTVTIGRAGYLLWKVVIVGLWQRRMQRLSREV